MQIDYNRIITCDIKKREIEKEGDRMQAKNVIVESLIFIDKHLDKPIDLTEVSCHSGYSKYYFSRMFKKYMGISVMDYVKKRRLIRASDEIIAGSRIIDVAMSYGYQSHSGFAKAFKQEFGFSPSFLRAMSMQIKNLGGMAMGYVFMRQMKEHADQEELFSILKEEIHKAQIEVDLNKLDKVYDYACRAYNGKKRYSGDEYITHTLNIAILLAQMEADEPTILAGLLCDVLQKTKIPLSELSNNFGSKISDIVAQLEIFDMENVHWEHEKAIMIKLAQRLHNMRTVEFMNESKRRKKAKETIQMFMPIAERLGNDKLSAELNDLSLKYM